MSAASPAGPVPRDPSPAPGEGRSAPASWHRRLVPLARNVFMGSLLFLGVLHVIFGEGLTRMLPAWPEGLPGRPLWAHMTGALIIVAAGGMLMGRARARTAAVALAALLLVPVLALHVPRALPTGEIGDAWLNVLKWLAMAAGPLVVAVHIPTEGDVHWRDRAVAFGDRAAPWLMGAFMVTSAVLHVRFAEFVSQLMQPWMPWRLFWTYFAAVALAAGGIGLVIPKTARLAALLTSAMILSWFVLVHTPRMLVDPTGPVGWSEMAESLAFSALALLMSVSVVRGRVPRRPREGSEEGPEPAPSI